MTDKVQIFRKEVERLKSNLIRGACASQIAMETRCKEEAYNEVLAILDTLQEEPVSEEWIEELRTKLNSMSKEDFKKVFDKYAINFDEEPVSRTPADIEAAMQEVEEKSRGFTKAHHGEDADTILAQMRGEEPVSDDEIEKQFKVGDIVVYISRHPAYSGLYLLGNPNDLSIGYSNANEPYQIALRNCTVASEDESRQFMRELNDNGYKWNEVTLKIDKKEKPVSEALEEASKEWLRPQLDKSYVNYGEVKMMELTHFDGYAMLDAIEFGAQWQQEKDSIPAEYLKELINNLSKQFPEVSFAKLSRIAVRVAKWKEEQDKKKEL